jgi:hypothetical protein
MRRTWRAAYDYCQNDQGNGRFLLEKRPVLEHGVMTPQRISRL